MSTLKLRTLVLGFAILLAATLSARAGTIVIPSYFTNYVLKASTSTNSGDTGLTTNAAYACIPIATITDITEAAAHSTTGDVRLLVYAIVEQYYTQYTALGTNATTRLLAFREAGYVASSATNISETVTHTLQTLRSISGGTIRGE